MKRFYCTKCQRVVRARSLPNGAAEYSANKPHGWSVKFHAVCRNHPNPIPSRRPMSFRALKGA